MEQQTVSLIIGIVGVAGTLLAGVLGAVVTLTVANREQQTTMSAVTTQHEASLRQLRHQLDTQVKMNATQLQVQLEAGERLRWQNDFRTTLAHFDSEVHHILMLGGKELEPLTDKQKAVYKAATFHYTRLQLMLHPESFAPDDAQQLEHAVESLAKRLLVDVKDSRWDAASKTRQELIRVSKLRLHKHWADIRSMIEEAKNLPTVSAENSPDV